MSCERPNILLIMTDQQRADHVGFGGNNTVRTPNLDAIAARGTVFDRAYVANPICMPNRATLMTGRLPSDHGVRFNGISLDWGANTYARVAREAGYRTALVGKSHLQIMNDAHGVIKTLFGDDPPDDAFAHGWPEGWDDFERMERWREENVDVPEDFYGFDHVRLTVFHSDLCSGHYYRWMLDKGVDPKAIQGRAVSLHSDTGTQQVWQTSMPEELYPTTYVVDEAIAFLEAQRAAEEPFLLKVSFPDPHHPFTPPGRYWDMYDPADMTLPETFWDDHKHSLSSFRQIVENRGDRPGLMMPFSPTEEQYRLMAAAEYGMITMIDDAVGRIMAALETQGLAEDTIVIFTSDHGDMFGDHGLMLKVSMHYDACIRVPLAIAGPGIGAGRASGLVSSLDLCPTLLSLMGVRPYYGITGRDLCPILSDADAAVRDFALIEEEQVFPDPATDQLIDMRSVVTQDARLTVHRGDKLVGELFDLKNDPQELRNLWDQPEGATLRAEMMERLAYAMIAETAPGEKPKAQA